MDKKAKKSDKLSDNELVEIIRRGKEEQYEEIIKRYEGKLFAYLYKLINSREEARDILQDVFIKAYKNLYSYDTQRKFSSWLYRIAHNEAVNFIKRKSLKKFVSWESITAAKDKLDMSSSKEDMERVWEKKEAKKEMDKVLKKLSPKYRQVIDLRYYKEKSYEEISQILKKPVNTVGTLISRAKKKLLAEFCQNKKANCRKKK